MNFLPTEDQEAVQAGLREMCERSFPDSRLGELAEARTGIDERIWRDLTQFGAFMLLEEGVADAALAAEVLGRRLYQARSSARCSRRRSPRNPAWTAPPASST